MQEISKEKFVSESKKVENIVKGILESRPEARNSDQYLIAIFYMEQHGTCDLMKLHRLSMKGASVSTCASLVRIRRNVQAKHFELAPTSEIVRKTRRINEENYREWYRKEYGIDYKEIEK